jgi:ABC-type Mn2+/Zn2+ transport system ATPase subunit
MGLESISEERLEELNTHIDTLVDIVHTIDLSKITVLTGNNSSGKSLVRKQLGLRVAANKGKMKSISMELRTSSNPSWGALSSAMCDTEWMATSYNTYKLLKSVVKAAKETNETQYLVLDEIEIGCSEETILAFVNMLNQELKDLPIGCLIITHSRLVVKELDADTFINLQNLTKDEWLNRKVIPTDLEALEQNELFFVVRERSKKVD